MHTRFLSIAIAAVLPALFAPAVCGQQACRVRALSLQAGSVAPELHANSEAVTATAGKVRVKTFLNHEYDTLKLKNRKLVFTAKETPTSGPDEEERVGSCEIPAATKSVILLFIAETPGKPGCRIVVVDDSVKAFSKGSIAIINLASQPVKIQLEDKSFEFKPGEVRAIPNPPAGKNQSSAMTGMVKRDGKWVEFSSGAWPHPGDKRVLQILTENPTTQQIEIRGVRDVVTP